MEIVTRPQPREDAVEEKKNIAAIVLAAGRSTAGRSSRMRGPNKLLAEFGGTPLVRRAAEAALASKASPVLIVTGHDEIAVRNALQGLDVRFVQNPAYAEGLSTSLKAGIGALGESVTGAVICLGDMPGVSAALIDKLIRVDRQTHCRLRAGARRPDRGAVAKRPSRQSGIVVAALLPRDHEVRGRHGCAKTREQLCRRRGRDRGR